MRIPPDSEKSNLIRIEGDPQGVQQAKRELLELASRMVSPELGPAEASHRAAGSAGAILLGHLLCWVLGLCSVGLQGPKGLSCIPKGTRWRACVPG